MDATIKAWRKRIYGLIHEMLVVERRHQLDDVEQRTDTAVSENLIETYSPILQWMREPILNSAAAARDEVIAEFGGNAGELASEILRLRMERPPSQARAGKDMSFSETASDSSHPSDARSGRPKKR